MADLKSPGPLISYRLLTSELATAKTPREAGNQTEVRLGLESNRQRLTRSDAEGNQSG